MKLMAGGAGEAALEPSLAPPAFQVGLLEHVIMLNMQNNVSGGLYLCLCMCILIWHTLLQIKSSLVWPQMMLQQSALCCIRDQKDAMLALQIAHQAAGQSSHM